MLGLKKSVFAFFLIFILLLFSFVFNAADSSTLSNFTPVSDFSYSSNDSLFKPYAAVFENECKDRGFEGACGINDDRFCENGNPQVCFIVGYYWNLRLYCNTQTDTCNSNEICVNPNDSQAYCDCRIKDLFYEYQCYSDDVYWYDNCGNRVSKKEECGSDSTEMICHGSDRVIQVKYGRGCSNGACFELGTTTTVGEYCDYPEYCMESSSGAYCGCKVNDTTDYYQCYKDDVYWYNNCGGREDKEVDCGSDSTELACSRNNVIEVNYKRGCINDECYESGDTGKVVEYCDSWEYCSDAKCNNGSISSIIWNKTIVNVGDVVNLKITTSNIKDGTEIVVQINENDVIFDDKIYKETHIVQNGIVSINLAITSNMVDSLSKGEAYARAYVKNDSSIKATSTSLKIRKGSIVSASWNVSSVAPNTQVNLNVITQDVANGVQVKLEIYETDCFSGLEILPICTQPKATLYSTVNNNSATVYWTVPLIKDWVGSAELKFKAIIVGLSSKASDKLAIVCVASEIEKFCDGTVLKKNILGADCKVNTVIIQDCYSKNTPEWNYSCIGNSLSKARTIEEGFCSPVSKACEVKTYSDTTSTLTPCNDLICSVSEKACVEKENLIEIISINIPTSTMVAGNEELIQITTKGIDNGELLDVVFFEDGLWGFDTKLEEFKIEVNNNRASFYFLPPVIKDLVGQAELKFKVSYGGVEKTSLMFRSKHCSNNGDCDSGFCDDAGYCFFEPEPMSCSSINDCPLGSSCKNYKCIFEENQVLNENIPSTLVPYVQTNFLYPYSPQKSILWSDLGLTDDLTLSAKIIEDLGNKDYLSGKLLEKFASSYYNNEYLVFLENPGASISGIGTIEIADAASFKISRISESEGEYKISKISLNEDKSSHTNIIQVVNNKLVLNPNSIDKVSHIDKFVSTNSKIESGKVINGNLVRATIYSRSNEMTTKAENVNLKFSFDPKYELDLDLRFLITDKDFGSTYIDSQGNSRIFSESTLNDFLNKLANSKSNPKALTDFIKINDVKKGQNNNNYVSFSSSDLINLENSLKKTNTNIVILGRINEKSVYQNTDKLSYTKLQLEKNNLFNSPKNINYIYTSKSTTRVGAYTDYKGTEIIQKNGVLEKYPIEVQMKALKALNDDPLSFTKYVEVPQEQFSGKYSGTASASTKVSAGALSAVAIMGEVAIVGGHVLDNYERVRNTNNITLVERQIEAICGDSVGAVRSRYNQLFTAYYNKLDPLGEYGVGSAKSFDFSSDMETYYAIHNLIYKYYNDPCKGINYKYTTLENNDLFYLYMNSKVSSQCEQFLPVNYLGDDFVLHKKISPECAYYVFTIPLNYSAGFLVSSPTHDAGIVVESPYSDITNSSLYKGSCKYSRTFGLPNSVGFSNKYSSSIGVSSNLYGDYKLFVIPHTSTKDIVISIQNNNELISDFGKSNEELNEACFLDMSQYYLNLKPSSINASINPAYLNMPQPDYDKGISNYSSVTSNIQATVSFEIINDSLFDIDSAEYKIDYVDGTITNSVGKISAGDKISVTKTLNFSSEGKKQIVVIIDPNNKIDERVEGDNSTEKSVTIYAKRINTAPELNNISINSINSGKNVEIKIDAVDSENDVINYSITPSVGISYLGNGVFNWSVPIDAPKYNNFSLTISDGVDSFTTDFIVELEMNLSVACYSNADCGTSSSSSNFCKSDDVYKTNYSWNCVNAGTTSSFCKQNMVDVLVNDCSNGCENGSCKTVFNIACYSNADCGVETSGNNFCSNGDVYKTVFTPTCNSAGTINSFCNTKSINVLVQNCSNGCANGVCLTDVPQEDYFFKDTFSDSALSEYSLLTSGENRVFVSNNELKVLTGWDDGKISFTKNLIPYTNGRLKFSYSRHWEGNSSGKNYLVMALITDLGLEIGIKIPYKNVEFEGGILNSSATNPHPFVIGKSPYYSWAKFVDFEIVYSDSQLRFAVDNAEKNTFIYGGNLGKIVGFVIKTDNISGTLDNLEFEKSNDEIKYSFENSTPNIACYSNADCGAVSYGNNYCSGGNVVRIVSSPLCVNSGTTSSRCSTSQNTQVVEVCSNGCANGVCSSSSNPGSNINMSTNNWDFEAFKKEGNFDLVLSYGNLWVRAGWGVESIQASLLQKNNAKFSFSNKLQWSGNSNESSFSTYDLIMQNGSLLRLKIYNGVKKPSFEYYNNSTGFSVKKTLDVSNFNINNWNNVDLIFNSGKAFVLINNKLVGELDTYNTSDKVSTFKIENNKLNTIFNKLSVEASDSSFSIPVSGELKDIEFSYKSGNWNLSVFDIEKSDMVELISSGLWLKAGWYSNSIINSFRGKYPESVVGGSNNNLYLSLDLKKQWSPSTSNKLRFEFEDLQKRKFVVILSEASDVSEVRIYSETGEQLKLQRQKNSKLVNVITSSTKNLEIILNGNKFYLYLNGEKVTEIWFDEFYFDNFSSFKIGVEKLNIIIDNLTFKTSKNKFTSGNITTVPIACYSSSDCSNSSISISSSKFCKNNDVYKTNYSWDCVNAGTASSFCKQNITDVLVEDCANGCNDGSCLSNPVLSVACSIDSDCPFDSFKENICYADDKYEIIETWACLYPGKTWSKCVKNDIKKIVEDCANGCDETTNECKDSPIENPDELIISEYGNYEFSSNKTGVFSVYEYTKYSKTWKLVKTKPYNAGTNVSIRLYTISVGSSQFEVKGLGTTFVRAVNLPADSISYKVIVE